MQYSTLLPTDTQSELSEFQTFELKPTVENILLSSQRKRSDHNIIILIAEGHYDQEIDFKNYSISKNQIVLIPRGVLHRECSICIEKGYGICFRQDFLAKPMIEMIDGFIGYITFKNKLNLALSPEQITEFLNLSKLIEQEKHLKEHQNKKFILQNLLLVWLNKMESLAQNHQTNNWYIENGMLFQKFIVLLLQNYKTNKEISFYCDNLQCTPAKLSKTIKSVTGKTTNEIIIDTVLLEAKRNLSFTNMSIKEIAYDLGYENQFYFSRIFKSKVKTSPDKFRKQHGL